MESRDELKEINIKSRTCYYFDNIVTDRDTDFSQILLDEKLYKGKYENTLIDDISYKTSMGAKPLRFRSDKIYRFIRVRGDEIRHLVLFDYGLFDKACDRIKYLISEKVVLEILLITTLEKSELIQIIIYLLKKY